MFGKKQNRCPTCGAHLQGKPPACPNCRYTTQYENLRDTLEAELRELERQATTAKTARDLHSINSEIAKKARMIERLG
jgi:predicted amidophosphoribosyltransferase